MMFFYEKTPNRRFQLRYLQDLSAFDLHLIYVYELVAAYYITFGFTRRWEMNDELDGDDSDDDDDDSIYMIGLIRA